jgi:hypothetical protein
MTLRVITEATIITLRAPIRSTIMDFRQFNEVAELVGIVAIVASLVFVGLELRQSQDIALADIEASFAAASIEMASLVSDNSEVWARGIAGEELDESEAVVFESIIIALSNRNWATQEQMRRLDRDEAADAVVHRFAAFLHQRPGARRAWVAREKRLKADREALDPWSASLTSNYVETILADLAVLDSREN